MAQFGSPVSNANGGPTFTASVHVTGTGIIIIHIYYTMITVLIIL